jgi:DNA-binding transcriptional ArsR family regulator
MKKHDAVAILSALAQDNRLDVFRLLVEAGPEGMPAGHVAASLKLPPSALSFHLDRLRDTGLVTVRRDGRSMIYAARYQTMNGLLAFLTANCCQGLWTSSVAEACAPVECKPAKPTRKKEGVA